MIIRIKTNKINEIALAYPISRFVNASLNTRNTAVVVELKGPPFVMVNIKVNSLNAPIVDITATKKIIGLIIGIVICKCFFQELAPSNSAASYKSFGTPWRAAK